MSGARIGDRPRFEDGAAVLSIASDLVPVGGDEHNGAMELVASCDDHELLPIDTGVTLQGVDLVPHKLSGGDPITVVRKARARARLSVVVTVSAVMVMAHAPGSGFWCHRERMA